METGRELLAAHAPLPADAMAAYTRLPSMSRPAAPAEFLLDRIRINTMRRGTEAGRPVWIKTRRTLARPVLAGANAFFSLAGAPLRALSEMAAWQNWEIDCFMRLHGEGFRAFAPFASAVAADELPGANLTLALDNGTITPPMSAAAGRELRRAHRLHCPQFGGPWSHGDPHLGNFIYDASADRARLIDFEVMHDERLPASERHADDLLVFLQDMLGRIRSDLWLPCAGAFLRAYDAPDVAALLAPKLCAPPRLSFARLWWNVRTGFLPAAECRRRLELLQAAIQSGEPGGPPSGWTAATHSPTG